jgi:flavin reductase (DIM6/NTAB) family NADH-FMN oxidoreductase RutF
MFASTGAKPDREGTKDSVSILRETGVFCVNIVEYAMREAMNRTSGPWAAEVDEFEMAGIEREDCRTIPCSRIKDAPAALECRVTQVVTLLGVANYVVFGEVTGVHLRDDCLVEGRFDVTRFQPVARLGYRDYTRVTELFTMPRPGE